MKKTNIIEYYENVEYNLTDEEIDQRIKKITMPQKIPKQHLQLITIQNQKIPIILNTTKEPNTKCKGTQGLIQIIKPETDTRTLRTIIQEHTDTILQEYQKTQHKKIHPNRTTEQFTNIIQKYLNHYQTKLNLPPIRTQYKHMITNKLGYANKNNLITFNTYLQYMDEELIKYVVYHEVCHIYTYKHHNTLGHGKEFQEILRKEYTQEEENKLIQN